MGLNQSYFDIRTEVEIPILIFGKYSDSVQVWNYYFDIQNPILTFSLRWKILFWYSKSYFDIHAESENPILKFKILFWHSHWVQWSYFVIQNPILTFAQRRKILF